MRFSVAHSLAVVAALLGLFSSQAAYSVKSTFPAPPRVKRIPESSIHPIVGVPRKIADEKFSISDTYAFSDKKVSEIPVWFPDGRDLLFAGTIPAGTEFIPEAQLSRNGRTFYGTSKVEGIKAESWVARRQSTVKGASGLTLFVDGGYLQRMQ